MESPYSPRKTEEGKIIRKEKILKLKTLTGTEKSKRMKEHATEINEMKLKLYRHDFKLQKHL